MSGYRVRVLNPAEDIDGAAALLAAEVPAFGGVRSGVEEHRRQLEWMLANPDLGDYPPGWVLEGPEGIAGIHLCAPKLYSDEQGGLPVFYSGYFYVKAAARGMESLGLFLAYRKLAASGLLMATTANANSAPLWHKLGGHAVPGTDHEWLRPLRLLPLAEESLHRRTGWKLRLSRLRPFGEGTPGKGWRHLSQPEELRTAALPASTGALMPVRSPAWLEWRFGPCSGQRLYQWHGGSASVFVAVSNSARGWRGQVRCLNVTDVWSASPIPGEEILDGLLSIYRGAADLLSVRGLGSLAEAARKNGWRRRVLEAPILWQSTKFASRAGRLAEFYPGCGL